MAFTPGVVHKGLHKYRRSRRDIMHDAVENSTRTTNVSRGIHSHNITKPPCFSHSMVLVVDRGPCALAIEIPAASAVLHSFPNDEALASHHDSRSGASALYLNLG